MKRRYLLPLLLITLATSCHKDKPPTTLPHNVRLIPQGLKDYWDFKPGTYWVYKDSVSGATDSVYVTDRTNYQFESTLSYNNQPSTCERLLVNMHSSLDGYDYDYGISTAWASSDPQSNVVNCSKIGVDTHSCFKYPLYIYNYIINASSIDSCVIIAIYQNYGVFDSVVRVDNTKNSFEGFYHTNAFYARHVGLIRYEVPGINKYRVLDHYHIEP